MLKNLLIYRFLVFNLLMLVALLAGVERGAVQAVVGGDGTGIVLGICAIFVVVTANTARHVWRTSRNLNLVKGLATDALGRCVLGHMRSEHDRRKAFAKVEWLHVASNWLVGLGLIGTVVGFAVALGGVDQDSLIEASGVQNAIGALMAGMRIALNTTIAGAVLGLWNEVNQRMLRTAMTCLWADVRACAKED